MSYLPPTGRFHEHLKDMHIRGRIGHRKRTIRRRRPSEMEQPPPAERPRRRRWWWPFGR